MDKSPSLKIVDSGKQDDATLEDRQTEEVVIALVGPVGSGVTTTGSLIKATLEEEYDYEVGWVTVSDLIKNSAGLVGEKFTEKEEVDRVHDLQGIGDKLRKKFSPAYLAEKCVETIASRRLEERGYRQTDDGIFLPLPRRCAHIIDSLKNPAEVKLLRDVYGDVFWLVGVFAPEHVRKSRLQDKGIPKTELDALIIRDENEIIQYGQKVRDTIEDADFFVRSDGENQDGLRQTTGRFLGVLFNISVATPAQDEMAMHSAISAGSRSACL